MQISGLVLSGFFRCLGAASTFILTFVVASFLSQEEAGKYFSFLAIVSLMAAFVGMGAGDFMVRVFSRKDSTGELAFLQGASIVLFNGFVCFVAFLVIFIIEFILGVDLVDLRLTAVALAAGVLLSFVQYLAKLLQAAGSANESIVFQYVIVPLAVSFASLCVVSFLGLALVHFLVILSLLIILTVRLRVSEIVTSFRLVIPSGSFIKSSVATWVIVLLNQVLVFYAYVVLSYYEGASEVAGYSVAQRLSMVVSLPMVGVGIYISSRVVKSTVEGDSLALRHVLGTATCMSFGLALFPFISLIVAGKEVLELFGPGYSSYYFLMLILSSAQFLSALIGPVDYIMIMSATKSEMYTTSLFILPLAFLAITLSVIGFGVIGAALSVFSLIVVQKVIYAYLIHRATGVVGAVEGILVLSGIWSERNHE